MGVTISVKLIFGFLLVFGLGVFFGLYALIATEREFEKAVGQTSMFIAEDKMDRVDKDIFLKIENIQIYSKDTALQSMLTASNRFFGELDDAQGIGADAFIEQQDRAWTSAAEEEVTPFMQEIISNEVSDALREEFLGFWEEKYGLRIYGEAFVTNAYGTNVAQTGKTTDYYQADEVWWQEAKEKGFFVGAIEYDESARIWTMPLGVRIEDRGGNFLGVIKAVPLANEMVREVEYAPGKYRTTAIKLLTSDGKIISSTRTFRVLEDFSKESFFRKIGSEGSGFFLAEEGGKEKLFAFARSRGYRDFAGLGWIVVIGHDTQEVFSTIRGLRRTLAGISIALFVVVVFFIVVLSRAILNPVRRLTEAADYIAKGNLNVRIKIESKDEIGHLGQSFNMMASKLRTSYETLEKKVETRTQELQERVHELDRTAKLLVRRDFELLQANEALREMDQAKSQFVSIAAHQLRTPISAVKWTIAMLVSGDFGKISKQVKDALVRADEALARLVKLIGDLLNVARIEEGRFVYRFAACRIEDICKSVYGASLASAERKKIRLTLSLPSKPIPEIYADSDNLFVVLQNIVDNALAYTEENGSVKITAARDPGNQDAVRISVEDTGMGIPASQQHLVGQKFFRGDNVMRRQTVGTGLGLYVVSRILMRHEAQLRLQSTEGKGTTVSFSLRFMKKK